MDVIRTHNPARVDEPCPHGSHRWELNGAEGGAALDCVSCEAKVTFDGHDVCRYLWGPAHRVIEWAWEDGNREG